MTVPRLACLSLLLLGPWLTAAVAQGGGEDPFAQGVAALDRKDYDRAIACFTACLGQNASDPVCLANRGLAHAARQQYDRALADFTQAAQLNPRLALVWVNRGLVYASKQEYGLAIADYNQAIRLEPQSPLAYYYRGNAHADRREFKEALADFSEVIRLEPGDAPALNNRGAAYANLHKYGLAVRDYTAAIKVDPKYAQALNNFAWLLATCPEDSLRDGKRALAHATSACALTQWKAAGPLSTLAAAHAECGDFPQAREWEARAIQAGFPDKADQEQARMRLKMYQAGKTYRDHVIP
jgi:tetratricopeptide (TPR) repeat protein